ncbi:MAG: DUF4905 domain-containing protein [Bacteroidetes bacterium]|nr:MAG: DUF4905 domain-containing protein [Bacteroidota bacterium]
MDLRSFFSSSLSPAWTYSVPHSIWRLLFTADGGIVLERRDTERKQAWFDLLDARSGAVRWSGLTFPEGWWVGLEGSADGNLFLHGYKKPDMPEHLGIICCDLATGKERWRNAECALQTVHRGSVYGFREMFERRKYIRLNGTTGAAEEELTDLPADADANAPLEKNDFQFPRALGDESAVIADGLRRAFPGLPAAEAPSLESLRIGHFHIVNRYAPNADPADGLRNTFAVIDTRRQKPVYSEQLNGSTPYPVPDSFFADGSRIYFIKERTALVALDLPQQ